MNELIEVPHSIEAERSVLGSILIDNTIFDDVAYLSAEDFYASSHRAIYSKMSKLLNAGQAVDPVILFEKWPGLVENGGLSYLGAMVKDTHTTANARSYAKIIRDKSRLRGLAKASREIYELMDSDDVDVAIDRAQSVVMNLSETRSTEKTTQEYLSECIDSLEYRYNNKGKLTGISTGLSVLDKKLNGLNKSNLIILAARPSMGKTTLMLNIAEHVSLTEGLPVAIFSMEMKGVELYNKMICSITGIDAGNYRANVDEHILEQAVLSSSKILSSDNITIIEDTPLTVNQIRSRCRKIKRTKGLSLVCIDYLQLMTGKGENRVQVISEISRGLKSLANELDMPVIALSQLNREVDKRANKRPVMSDLRDSGAIEQDADVIMFMYREAVYNEHTNRKGITEIDVAKQRHGTTGTEFITDQLEHSRFKDFYGELPSDEQESGGLKSRYDKR